MAFSDTFKELKDHIENSSKAIKDFTVEELDALKTALSESKTNLSNLEHLTTITKDILLFKNGSASQLEKLNSEIENNNKVLQQISSDINSLVTTTKNRGIAASISNLWKWITAKNEKFNMENYYLILLIIFIALCTVLICWKAIYIYKISKHPYPKFTSGFSLLLLR